MPRQIWFSPLDHRYLAHDRCKDLWRPGNVYPSCHQWQETVTAPHKSFMHKSTPTVYAHLVLQDVSGGSCDGHLQRCLSGNLRRLPRLEARQLTIWLSRSAGTRDVCRSTPECRGQPRVPGLRWRTAAQTSWLSRSQSVSPAYCSPGCTHIDTLNSPCNTRVWNSRFFPNVQSRPVASTILHLLI